MGGDAHELDAEAAPFEPAEAKPQPPATGPAAVAEGAAAKDAAPSAGAGRRPMFASVIADEEDATIMPVEEDAAEDYGYGHGRGHSCANHRGGKGGYRAEGAPRAGRHRGAPPPRYAAPMPPTGAPGMEVERPYAYDEWHADPHAPPLSQPPPPHGWWGPHGDAEAHGFHPHDVHSHGDGGWGGWGHPQGCDAYAYDDAYHPEDVAAAGKGSSKRRGGAARRGDRNRAGRGGRRKDPQAAASGAAPATRRKGARTDDGASDAAWRRGPSAPGSSAVGRDGVQAPAASTLRRHQSHWATWLVGDGAGAAAVPAPAPRGCMPEKSSAHDACPPHRHLATAP